MAFLLLFELFVFSYFRPLKPGQAKKSFIKNNDVKNECSVSFFMRGRIKLQIRWISLVIIVKRGQSNYSISLKELLF